MEATALSPRRRRSAWRAWLGPGVAVVVLAGLVVAWRVTAGKPAPAPSSGPQIMNVNADNVDAATLTSGGKTLKFVRVLPPSATKPKGGKPPSTSGNAVRGQWHLGSATGPALKSFSMTDLLLELNPLQAQRAVAATPSAAGLAPAVTTLRLHLTNGTTAVLEVGNPSPVGSGFYARAGGSSKVYLIDSTVPNQLVPDPAFWLAPAKTTSPATPSPSGTPGAGGSGSAGGASSPPGG